MASFGCILGSVIQPMGHTLREPRQVAIHVDWCATYVLSEGLLRLLDKRKCRFDTCVGRPSKVDYFSDKSNLPSSDPRSIEQVVDDSRELTDFPIHDSHQIRFILERATAYRQQVQSGADGGNCVANFVRQSR